MAQPRPLFIVVRLVLLTFCIMMLPVAQAIGTEGESVDPLNPAAAYGPAIKYGIYRNGKRIGSHTVSFSKDGSDLEVAVASKLVVTVLKIPVYRFNYTANERWQDGVLQEVTATVEEKGETRTVSLERQGDKTLLTEPSGKTTLQTLEFASNHWHPGVLQTPAIFNTLTGKANKIQIIDEGIDRLTTGDQVIEATHYRYSGQLQTDVWYDKRQRWVKLRFKGSDGSTIEYRSVGFNS